MAKRKSILFFIITLTLVLLSACGNANQNPATAMPTSLLGNEDAPPPPPLDPQKVVQGQGLYNQYCAECHAANGEGQPDWKTPNEDGTFKSPPHDASGHTWHHDDDLLLDIIANGSKVPQSQMPAFGNQLSDEEILAILEYMKTWWGPEERAFQWQVTWQVQQRQ